MDPEFSGDMSQNFPLWGVLAGSCLASRHVNGNAKDSIGQGFYHLALKLDDILVIRARPILPEIVWNRVI